MSKGRLFIISAPSGAGKTSLTHALIERLAERGRKAAFSVSYTTRKPRPSEKDGKDYHFISPDEFKAMVTQDAFLEHAEVFGRHYGTGRAVSETVLDKGVDLILDIDWQGAQQVRQRMPEAVSIFLKPPSLLELERRLRRRGQDDDATIAMRMEEAEAELAHADEYDHVLINDDFQHTLMELHGIFKN
ncbi:MAG: guanylate kinase [Nevskiales bacterium]